MTSRLCRLCRLRRLCLRGLLSRRRQNDAHLARGLAGRWRRLSGGRAVIAACRDGWRGRSGDSRAPRLPACPPASSRQSERVDATSWPPSRNRSSCPSRRACLRPASAPAPSSDPPCGMSNPERSPSGNEGRSRAPYRICRPRQRHARCRRHPPSRKLRSRFRGIAPGTFPPHRRCRDCRVRRAGRSSRRRGARKRACPSRPLALARARPEYRSAEAHRGSCRDRPALRAGRPEARRKIGASQAEADSVGRRPERRRRDGPSAPADWRDRLAGAKSSPSAGRIGAADRSRRSGSADCRNRSGPRKRNCVAAPRSGGAPRSQGRWRARRPCG